MASLNDNYPPSAINALAFSHASTPTVKSKNLPDLRLALGRANGDIEIWNPLGGAWFQERVIPGGKDRSIEGLVWTQDPDEEHDGGKHTPGKLRLFSIGYSTAVTEWDLSRGSPLRHTVGNYGELWCIAAQPRMAGSTMTTNEVSNDDSPDSAHQYQSIVVGCADGAIVLLSTAHGDLRFLKTVAKPTTRNVRVLSITFQTQSIVIAGHSDSVIRVFDVRKSQLLRNLSLGAGPIGGPKDILVWSVKCLIDGSIVSGDSTGTLRFWDGHTYSLIQRIKTHVADVLDVVASTDGETVISGGMDRRTTIYRRTGRGNAGTRGGWAEVAHERFHKHDVKAMAIFESKDMSVLLSGGLDTTPIVMPVREYGREHHRSLSNLPRKPILAGGPTERLLVSWWGLEIKIWRIVSRNKPGHSSDEDYARQDGVQTSKPVARVMIQGDEALTCVDLSANNSLLAAATQSGLRVFHLKRKAKRELKISKLAVSADLAGAGASIVKFSPDGKWLALVRPDSKIELCRISENASLKGKSQCIGKVLHVRRLPRRQPTVKEQRGGLGAYERCISCVAFSADSKILAVGDLSGYLDTWILEGTEVLTQAHDEQAKNDGWLESSDEETNGVTRSNTVHGQRWVRNPAVSLIPSLGAAPLILTFRRPREYPLSGRSNGNVANGTMSPTTYAYSRQTNPESRLVVLTSKHQLLEFEILAGRISDWSRRNPTSRLPKAFQDIKDRAKGSVWAINSSSERLWIYGSSWLWMFDLSQDFPDNREPSDQASRAQALGTDARTRKRKRIRPDDQPLGADDHRAGGSGAGSKICPSELRVGISMKFRKFEGPDQSHGQWVSTSVKGARHPHDDDDEAGLAENSALIELRHRALENERAPHEGIPSTLNTNGELPIDRETRAPRRSYNKVSPFWGTHKYRDILGIVPFCDEGDKQNAGIEEKSGDGRLRNGSEGIEAALVERPLWDADLPPRFYGSYEREEPQLSNI